MASQARALTAGRADGSTSETVRSQSGEAYLRIRDRIVSLDMPPGPVVQKRSLRLWYLVLDHGVRLREAVAEHVQLLRAVLAGDGQGAEECMKRHVVGFEREIRKVLVER